MPDASQRSRLCAISPGSPVVPAAIPADCGCRGAVLTQPDAPQRPLAERLAHLYLCEQLSTYAIGRMTGMGRQRVTRLLHHAGVPLRPRGAGGRRPGRRRDDPPALDQVPGPIWVRFPEPVPLTVRLVEDLYWHCGAALHHIELLTGQPADTVRGFMRRSGIGTRQQGGRSPFMRRWQAGDP